MVRLCAARAVVSVGNLPAGFSADSAAAVSTGKPGKAEKKTSDRMADTTERRQRQGFRRRFFDCFFGCGSTAPSLGSRRSLLCPTANNISCLKPMCVPPAAMRRLQLHVLYRQVKCACPPAQDYTRPQVEREGLA